MTELGDFLQAHRARLRPEDVDLPHYGRRRVRGLRREEIAQLAGVSASYYTRLEQGQSRSASVEVLDALARALRLDQDEHAHLHDLAAATRSRRAPRRPPAEHASRALTDLLRSVGDVPAVVTGRRGDVLAWNRMGHALFAGHLDPTAPERPADRPNTAKLVFLDAHVRALYADWPAKARSVVEHLRLTAGRHPDDPLLAALVGELTMRSPEFARLWLDHRVRACGAATYDVHHPLVGALTITQQTFAADEQSLLLVTTGAGSPAEAALLLLASSVQVAVGGGGAGVQRQTRGADQAADVEELGAQRLLRHQGRGV